MAGRIQIRRNAVWESLKRLQLVEHFILLEWMRCKRDFSWLAWFHQPSLHLKSFSCHFELSALLHSSKFQDIQNVVFEIRFDELETCTEVFIQTDIIQFKTRDGNKKVARNFPLRRRWVSRDQNESLLANDLIFKSFFFPSLSHENISSLYKKPHNLD